jgi:hypothetical protein
MNSGPKKHQSHNQMIKNHQNHKEKQRNPKPRSYLGWIYNERHRLPSYHPSYLKYK